MSSQFKTGAMLIAFGLIGLFPPLKVTSYSGGVQRQRGCVLAPVLSVVAPQQPVWNPRGGRALPPESVRRTMAEFQPRAPRSQPNGDVDIDGGRMLMECLLVCLLAGIVAVAGAIRLPDMPEPDSPRDPVYRTPAN